MSRYRKMKLLPAYRASTEEGTEAASNEMPMPLPPGIVSARAAVAAATVKGRSSASKARREKVRELAAEYRLRDEARRLAAYEPSARVSLPEAGKTLADDLAVPRVGAKYAVQELHTENGNSLLVAEKKAGKTTLTLNLAKALADDEPFLDRFSVEPLTGRVAFFNYELDADMFREWAGDVEIAHPEKIAPPLHLRGATLPFWIPEELERIGRWLRRERIEWLVVDPAARAWGGLVTQENSNAEVGAFTDALDALKRHGRVPNLLLATHTGRAKHEEGQEQSRGATRLEDWADSLWYLTKDREGRRSFRATGRDVEVEALDLQYVEAERRLQASGQSRRERLDAEGMLRVVDALGLIEEAGGGAPTTTDLEKRIEGNQNKRSQWIQVAAEEGLIERRSEGKALRCHMTGEGRKVRSRRVKLADEEE